MGNEQASQIVLAPGIETNQGESARPPMMRYSIGDEDSELFSEHRTPGGAVKNVITEAPRSSSFQILPPKQAEVFRTPEECHSFTACFFDFSSTITAFASFSCKSFRLPFIGV